MSGLIRCIKTEESVDEICCCDTRCNADSVNESCPKAGITDAENNVKYYDFENVTSNHTLVASFEAISPDDNGGSDNSGNSALVALFDTSVGNDVNVISISNTVPASKDSEPKTGDASYMEIYATITMIAGLSYLLLYFADGKSGMTEEEKKEIVASLVNWVKKGSRVKKYAALAVIFLILVYYHSIGKRTTVDWKEVYEK